LRTRRASAAVFARPGVAIVDAICATDIAQSPERQLLYVAGGFGADVRSAAQESSITAISTATGSAELPCTLRFFHGFSSYRRFIIAICIRWHYDRLRAGAAWAARRAGTSKAREPAFEPPVQEAW